ncbi:hypothetical protein B0O99DRAFT_595123 [Bisporella sp. PMI_857]|nr:hypothetical protein B0O99DRAFT_595123 [Bisporella sp. PMI_857]
MSIAPDLNNSYQNDEPPPYFEVCGNSPRQCSAAMFSVFPELPTELRMRVWQLALEPRIVRWSQTSSSDGSHSAFEAFPKSVSLLSVSQEARTAAFLYGEYQTLNTKSKIYFSPMLDYLWFNPGWFDSRSVFAQQRTTTLALEMGAVFQDFACVKKVMVHPNWDTEFEAKPSIQFTRLPLVEQVLVVADEKSVGLRSEIMLRTTKEVARHYVMFHEGKQNIRYPHVAVGCLRWSAAGKGQSPRSPGSGPQLVAIFESSEEMKAHLSSVLKAELEFTKQRFGQPKIVHKLRFKQRPTESVPINSTHPIAS